MNVLNNVTPILGEVEAETWPQTDLARWQERHNAKVIHSLEDLRRILETAHCFIGNDSGPTHMAAQMGLPTLALFGPTSPRTWGPRGPQVRVLSPHRPQPITRLTLESLLLAGRRPPALL